MGILVSIISYSKLSGNYNKATENKKLDELYHILNCQGTITHHWGGFILYQLYHILNCQGTITNRTAIAHYKNYIIF